MRGIKFKPVILLLAAVFYILGCQKSTEQPDRDKFLGTYSVVDSCSISGVKNYDITISKTALSENTVVISNFGNFTLFSVPGEVYDDRLTFEKFANVSGEPIKITGHGTFSGLSLKISYFIERADVHDWESCYMNCTKK